MFDSPVGLGLGLGFAYFVGCISSSYYFVRLVDGRDIRQIDTGTAGAMNVSRLLGLWAGVAVAFADMLKGYVAVAIGSWIAQPSEFSALTFTAVICGHVWPLQLGFRGGKGLAPGLGALMWFSPETVGVVVAICVGILLLLHSKTLGSMVATALVPPLFYLFSSNGQEAVLLAIPCTLVLLNHRNNIRHELSGKF